LLVVLLVFCSLSCAIVPAALFLRNLRLYAPPPRPTRKEAISVLIPARNEQDSIELCVRAALLSESVDVEVIVLDDHSEDKTAAIVDDIARTDHRVRFVHAPPLPPGWCGKQFACWLLAGMASRPLLCFLDADVRLQPDGLARMAGALRVSGASLISGFPRHLTVTPFEQLLLPLMHFLLLGFLPFDRMRRSSDPSLGAGCGQIFVADREAYWTVGGHGAIRESRHDGLTLPRAFRRAGAKTDLCDATSVASCRMYPGGREVFAGLLKNASEGLAAPTLIAPVSVLLALGQIVPVLLLAYVLTHHASVGLVAAATIATVASYLPRILAVFRFQQPLLPALFHPLAIATLLSIQWLALFRMLFRIPATWKGRSYSTP
jgi:hypothetical protein